ncbi:MAG: hypothetical protein GY737_30190 [Desulfobacteraceae bacterium]|nr:hypothetical protein [Desulfobacteraceae bacterium]
MKKNRKKYPFELKGEAVNCSRNGDMLGHCREESFFANYSIRENARRIDYSML